MDFRFKMPLRGAAVAASILAASSASAQEDISTVYSGQSITVVVGAATGSLQDRYARVIGRYLIKHVPGSPTIRYRNMPGASGQKAALWLFSTATRDGLTFSSLTPDVIAGPLLGDEKDKKFDPLKFNFIGSAASPVYICLSRPDAPAASFSEVRSRRLVMGALKEGGATQDISYALINLAGARFRIVPHYRDRVELLGALEHGEVHGACGFSWSTLRTRWPELLKEKKTVLFLQVALKPRRDLTRLNVPIVWDFIDSTEDRTALELLARAQQVGIPYAAPPRVLRRRVAALRVAFERTMKDLEFKAETRKAKLDLSPIYGDDLQRVIEKIYQTPSETVAKARAARRPGG